MHVDDIVYILDLFPDAEVVWQTDGSFLVRRTRTTTEVTTPISRPAFYLRPDGTLQPPPGACS
jgi:hypothetical protein